MRGFALQYKIRKTTTKNKSGDNYSITVPRFIAKQFEDCLFKLEISGNSFLFISGCKISNEKIENKNKFVIGGAPIVFQ